MITTETLLPLHKGEVVHHWDLWTNICQIHT
jgi:hypothetical protein